jgi:hypothetical protein
MLQANRSSVLASIAILTVLSMNLAAQLTTATLSGTVTDSSGAVVAEAQVSATNRSTGATARAQANGAGFYVLTGLAPGAYQLRVEKAGFQTYVAEGVTLAVNQPVTVNPSLQVGAATQTVQVEASADQINLRSQTLSYEVNTQMVRELPLNGRNILQLMQLAPDAAPVSTSGGASSYQQSASRPEIANTYVSASGGRANSTGFYLDGAVNEDALTEIANIFPNPDAIQEFSFETNNYSAKFGGRGGGVMNAVTRGGANQFHGALFEFVRNSDFNARNFFSAGQDGLKRNQYGGTVGGPVRKDKTFFFFSYQGTNLRQTALSNSATTLTAAQRAGDFSADKGNIVDPTTSAPFAGKQVPVSRFDPIALKILSWVPVGAPGTGVVYYPSRTVQNDKQFVTRVDHNISQKFRIYASYLYDGLTQPATTVANDLLTASPDQYWRSQNFVINATYTFRSNLLATFVGSISRRLNTYTGPTQFPDWPDLGAAVPKMVTGGSKTSLDLSIGNYFSTSWDGIYTIPSTIGEVGTHWSYIKGSHSVDFGAEIIKSKVVKDQDFLSDGSYTFSGTLSGDNALDFLLSRPSQFQQQEPFYIVPIRTLPAAYVADTWKVSRRLTLNVGLRWNPFVPVFENSYHQEGIFSYAYYNQGVRSTLYPNLPPGLLVSGDPGIPKRIINSNYRIFNPRVGFAFDPFGDGKTSIRAGFGIFQDQMQGNTINPNYSPFNVNATIAFPVSTENPYQGQYNPFPISRPNPSNLIFPLPELANPFTLGMQGPAIQQWNFTVERQFPWSMMLRVAYEGMESYHLPGAVEGNLAVYNPSLTAAQNRTQVNARRPMGQYYQGLYLGENVGTASFQGLNISIEKRMSAGLTFLAGYRWSKCLDENESATTYSALSYSTTNPRNDRGVCGYNIPNQFRLSYSWIVPTPKRWGALASNVLGNWETNGIFTVRSGIPFNITSGVDNSLTAIGLDRADLVGNPNLPGGRSKAQELQQWFNTQAFAANALGTYGTTPRNYLEGPGFANMDFSIVRSFPIRKGPLAESQMLQFRAEFFNVFNHANFNNPTSSVSSTAFGRILGAADPRIIQLGLKFVY